MTTQLSVELLLTRFFTVTDQVTEPNGQRPSVLPIIIADNGVVSEVGSGELENPIVQMNESSSSWSDANSYLVKH